MMFVSGHPQVITEGPVMGICNWIKLGWVSRPACIALTCNRASGGTIVGEEGHLVVKHGFAEERGQFEGRKKARVKI